MRLIALGILINQLKCVIAFYFNIFYQFLHFYFWIPFNQHNRGLSVLQNTNWTGASISYKTSRAPSEDSDRPAKTQIRLRIRAVWSESSQRTLWIAKDPKRLQADTEDSDQPARMCTLIWVFARRTCNLEKKMMCPGSFVIGFRYAMLSLATRNAHWITQRPEYYQKKNHPVAIGTSTTFFPNIRTA